MKIKETKKKRYPPFDPVEFKMKFRAFFATLVFVLTMVLIFCVAFLEPGPDQETIKYALSFLLGSVLTAVITFYFDGNETQTNVVDKVQLNSLAVVQEENIPQTEQTTES